jgi:hypothetical protein
MGRSDSPNQRSKEVYQMKQGGLLFPKEPARKKNGRSTTKAL